MAGGLCPPPVRAAMRFRYERSGLREWSIAAELVMGDGTVSIRSTKLEGMSDFIAVPESHTLIMRSEAAGLQVIEFLEHGRFKHPGP